MDPRDKKQLSPEEILEQEEFVDMMVTLNEDDFAAFKPADEYDEEIDNALLEEEMALLDKYGF